MKDNTYQIPTEFVFRLHHVRPRFKSNPEQVLIPLSKAIEDIGLAEKKNFIQMFEHKIRSYFPEQNISRKTIDNWRTEISSLFSLLLESENYYEPMLRTIQLAATGDLSTFFRHFLFYFQYPGCHLAPNRLQSIIEANIAYHPASHLLLLLDYMEQEIPDQAYVTVEEYCNCIFRDLRCIRDNEPLTETWKRIETNRVNNVEYESKSDIKRYADDILFYMKEARLLNEENGHYRINPDSRSFVNYIIRHASFSNLFHNFDGSKDSYVALRREWSSIVNITIPSLNSPNLEGLEYFPDWNITLAVSSSPTPISLFPKDVLDPNSLGKIGENIVLNYEKKRLDSKGLLDLSRKVMDVSQENCGFDILSFNEDGSYRYIEVKTTLQTQNSQIHQFSITENEWNNIEKSSEHYYIYRVLVSIDWENRAVGKASLCEIKDPFYLHEIGMLTKRAVQSYTMQVRGTKLEWIDV